MIEYKIPNKESGPAIFNMALHSLRIVFMGTPEFAVASLDALIKGGFNIVAVITAPDKPSGRGMKMNESPVKKYAIENSIPVLQPEKLKDPEFLNKLKTFNADLQIVVAFRMLPELVWNMPPLGTINLHGSLLPQYRGAAPINWAIINGEKETGVTTFKLKHEIDTGDILLQESFPIGENETAGEVHERMKEIGAQLLVKTVKGLADGILKETPQSAIGNRQSVILHHAPKIFTDTCSINWNNTVEEVHNLIRGLAPYPAAFTFLNGKKVKVYKVDKVYKVPAIAAGEFETDHKTFLQFACTNGYLILKDIQLEGKKRMRVENFLRGFQLHA